MVHVILVLLFICLNFFSLLAQKGSFEEARPVGGFTQKIAGVWDCGEFGKLTLTQSGNRVTGTISVNGGSVDGSIIENQFIGKWAEKVTKDAGSFEFDLEIRTMSPDPTHLVGKYNFTTNRTWTTGWNCNK